jgi:hypothetical protein
VCFPCCYTSRHNVSELKFSNLVSCHNTHALMLYEQVVFHSRVVIDVTLFRKLHSHNKPQPHSSLSYVNDGEMMRDF